MDPRRFVETMFLCYNEKDAPVGSFVIVNPDDLDNYYNCGTYVEKNHRRLGYGKRMIEVAKYLGYTIVPWKDGIIANLFYNSANV
jgi:hypothetical protein